MNNLITISQQYVRNHLSVLPIKLDNKKPKLETWKRLQTTTLTETECERAFYDDCLIGLIGGKVSGNLEMIDVDNHLGNARELFEQLKSLIDTFSLPWETTKNGGYHIFYKCSSPVEYNQLLAMQPESDGTPIAVIETRGEGGYCVVSPSIGYTLMEGDIFNIPIIDKEQRDYIISECRTQGTCLEEPKKELKKYTPKPIPIGSNDRIGNEYNRSQEGLLEVRALLKIAGWVFDKSGMFARRPNKKGGGYSATLGKVFSKAGFPLFYNFSPNSPNFEMKEGISYFYVFARLAYNNDFKAAARELHTRQDTIRNIPHTPRELADRMKVVPRAGCAPEPKINLLPAGILEGNNDDRKKLEPMQQAVVWLKMTYSLRYDVVKNIVQAKLKSSTKWEQCNENDLYLNLHSAGIKIKKTDLQSILGSSNVPKYNAFKEYFKYLPKWNGINHFIELAGYLNIDEKEFFITMLEKQFVRTIKCALEPTFFNRFALVFRSNKQELGKSRLVQFFNPFGTKYYSTEFLTSNKDSIIALSENFIYNLDDLDDLNKQTGGLGKLKALLAKSVINVRVPYGHQKVDLERRCSFFGSTNRSEFLTDDYNTRWLIFNINTINERLFFDVDINKLWEQAYALYQSEEYEWDLTDEEKAQREEMNLGHKESTLEQELLATHFVKTFTDDECDLMSLANISHSLAQLGYFNGRININLSYIQSLLIGMGFEERIKTMNNTIVKWYRIKEIHEIGYEKLKITSKKV